MIHAISKALQAGRDRVELAQMAIRDRLQGKPVAKRSNHWPSVRRAHLKLQPDCQWCGSVKGVQVHHKQPYHLKPQLELEPSNFITLCETPGLECHLHHGHLGNWKNFNPAIQAECDARHVLNSNIIKLRRHSKFGIAESAAA